MRFFGSFARLLVALSFFSSIPALGATAPVSHHEIRRVPSETVSVIVEFRKTPAARKTGSAMDSHDSLFDRFRSDLIGPATNRSRSAAPPVLRHEFRRAILGAAVELHPAGIERLRELPYVARVTLDPVLRVSTGDPIVPGSVIDARPRVNAMSLGTGGEGIVVAVIDTGIDYMHPALGGGFGPGFKVAGGWDFVNDDPDPIDDNGHGTHVAGTIAANGAEIFGVAPDATLLAYKILGAGGNGNGSDIIAAIEMALDPNGDGDFSDRADVMNLSVGSPGDAEDPMSRAVDSAVAAGVVMVVAAGNDGGTSTIGSPGTAVEAITVGATDDQHAMTSFSSRGPSPRLLGFKPDVAAPGYQIPSTWIGGGFASINGTSMATPHVAGVAALLRKLHPEWDPTTVKRSIVAGAGAVVDQPFARGAGYVDAAAAHAAKLHRDQTGLSFGLRPANTGSSEQTKSVRLWNRSSQALSLSISAGIVPAGVAILLSPTTLQIPAGESRDLQVTLQTSNERLEYPSNGLVGGDLLVSGSSSGTIPWGILRTARATVRHDGLVFSVFAIDHEGGRLAAVSGSDFTEFFLPPGRTWDFAVISYDIPVNEGGFFDTRRTVIREGIAIDADHLIDLRGSEATLELVLDPRDQSGQSLLGRSGASRPLHFIGARFLRHQDDDINFTSLSVVPADFMKRHFYSPVSDRYTLYHYEHYFDHDTFEWYTIEHDVLRGLQQGRTLTTGGSDLLHATLEWRRPQMQKEWLDVCSYDALTTRLTLSWTSCFATAPGAKSSIELYATEEQSALAHSGMSVRSGTLFSQAMRARAGELVISSDPAPGPLSPRLKSGETYVVGAGTVHPFQFPGTTSATWAGFPWAGLYGASGEMILDNPAGQWRTWNASGELVAEGSWGGSTVPPRPSAGGRFVAELKSMEGFSHWSRGVLDVTFGSDPADLTAPTLTSLRVTDSDGAVVFSVEPGKFAILKFSVADADFARGGATNLSRPEATRAWARAHETVEWVPLPLSITGNESGSLITLRHFPAGDMYLADLTPLTATERWIDLRIEFEDLAGNRVSWIQEMAFAVGDPRSERRRAASR